MSWRPCSKENKDCPLFITKRGCYEDVHHDFWPRRDYTTETEKAFRELEENKTRLCRAEHQDVHATEDIPLKPSLEVMRYAIEESRLNRVDDTLEASNE